MTYPVTDNTVKTPRHTSFYLACGEEVLPVFSSEEGGEMFLGLGQVCFESW
jgi:hypothetical protein